MKLHVLKYIHLYESQFILNSNAMWTSALALATEQPHIYFNMSEVWHSSSMSTFRKCMRCRKERAHIHCITCYITIQIVLMEFLVLIKVYKNPEKKLLLEFLLYVSYFNILFKCISVMQHWFSISLYSSVTWSFRNHIISLETVELLNIFFEPVILFFFELKRTAFIQHINLF